MIEPHHCRPEAFELFSQQLATLDQPESLLRGAIAISMHALDDVVPEDSEDYLRALAARVLARVRNRSASALLAHLHQVVFEEEGFAGNQGDYYQPLNSYVPAVIALKRGLPITISLIYKVVGEHVGLRIEGINAPTHFLVRVKTEYGWQIIDPFFRGSVLTEEEAYLRIEQVVGCRIPHTGEYLSTASHDQWLRRILANLQNVLAAHERDEDLAAMNELHHLLDERTQHA